jgi:hypothetical protein
MSGCGPSSDDASVPQYRIHHRHEPAECGPVVASWKGWASPLRPEAAVSSCPFGGHESWWDVEGGSEAEVLALLPPFVAERSTATRTTSIP